MVGKDAVSQEDLMDQDKVNLIGYGISLAVGVLQSLLEVLPEIDLSRNREPQLPSLSPLAAPASLLIIPKSNKKPHKVLHPLKWV